MDDDCEEESRTTERLVQVKLATEIFAALFSCFVMLDQMDHTHALHRNLDELKRRLRVWWELTPWGIESRFRKEVGGVLWEAMTSLSQ
jgi:hypothetical protein